MVQNLSSLKDVFKGKKKDLSQMDSWIYAGVNILHNRPYYMSDPKDDSNVSLLLPYQAGQFNQYSDWLGIAQSRFDFQEKQEILYINLALDLTQSSIRLLGIHTPSSRADVKIAWGSTSTDHVFMACCWISHKDNFILSYFNRSDGCNT